MQEPGDNSANENDPLPSQEELLRIVSEMETDDNIEKLAQKLFAEWKQNSENSGEEPDLTFGTFAEKLKERLVQ